MADDRKDAKNSLSKTIKEQNLKFSVEFDDGGDEGDDGEAIEDVNESPDIEEETDGPKQQTSREKGVAKKTIDNEKGERRKGQGRSDGTENVKDATERRSRNPDVTRKREAGKGERSKSRSPEVASPKRQRPKRGTGNEDGTGTKTRATTNEEQRVHLPPLRNRQQGGVKEKWQKPGDPGEIPIYARIRGPGPAHYMLPTTVGRQSNDNTRRVSPAYSFGTRSWSFKSDSPGPAYNFDPLLGPRGRESKPSFSFGTRAKTPVRKNETPGPGAYNTDTSPLWEKRSPHYSMSSRNKQRSVDQSPSPNIYQLPPMLGDRVPHAKGGPAVSMSPRREKHGFAEDHAKTPGPAAYGMFSPSLTKAKPPEYTVKGRTFQPGPKNFVPGPGTYSPQNVNSHLEQSPRHVIGVRHSEFKMPTITPADVTN